MSLSSSDIATNNQGTQSNTLAVEAYVSATLLQQDFPPLANVPNLQGHQKTAKDNAQAWRVTVRPKLYQTNEDLLAYSNEFQSFYKVLYGYAQNLESDPSARGFLSQGLGILQKDVQKNQTNSQIAYNTLNDFQQKVNQDQNNLGSDNSLIKSEYDGDQGLLQQYQDKIDADRDAMGKDLSMIAGGSAMDIVGGLMITVGVLAEIATAGVSTGLIVGGIAVVAGGSTMIGLSAKDYDDKAKDLAETTAKLAAVSAEITLAESLFGTTSYLNQLAQQALVALDALNKSWTILLNDFAIVISAIDSVNPDYPSPFVCALLDAASKDWELVDSSARLIRQQIVNPQIDTSAIQNGTLPTSYTGSTSLAKSTSARRAVTNNVVTSSRAITNENSTTDAVTSLNISLKNLNSVTDQLLSQYHSLPSTANSPKDVQNNFNAVGSDIPAVNSSVDLLTNDLYTLGKYSAPLAQIAVQNPVNIVYAKQIFAEISQTTANIQKGSSSKSDTDLQKLTTDTTNTYTSLDTWKNSINNTIQQDQSTIDSLNRKLNSLQKQKDDIKKDWWYCLLGAVACGITAAVIASQINGVNDDITKERNELSKENAELSNSIHLLQSVSSLEISSGTAASYSNAIYSALQTISSDLANVAYASDSVVVAFATAQAASLAAVISLLAPPSLKANSLAIKRVALSVSPLVPPKTLLAVTDIPADDELIEVLRDFTAELILFEQSLGVILYQPPISLTLDSAALILQDEKVVQTHAYAWNSGDRSKAYGILQQFVSSNNLLSSLLNVSLNFIQQNDINNAILGINSAVNVVSDLSNYIKQNQSYLQNGAGRDFQNDNAHFQVVGSLINQSFEGDKGQLAQLQNQLESLRTTINENNKTIADGATKTVAKLLLTEAVAVGLAFGLGAIAIPAAAEGAAELTVLYSKMGKEIISGSSEAAKDFASDTFTKTVTEDNSNFMEDANKAIQSYGDTLKSLSSAFSDAGVVYTLIGDVSIAYDSFDNFTTGINAALPLLSQFKYYLSNIPYTLKAGQASDSISSIQNAIKLSNHVAAASQQFLTSILLTSTSAPPTKQ